MYGTVARMKIKPGMEQSLMEQTNRDIPGMVFNHVYRLDSGENDYYLVVGFESREAYEANANSPEMHEQYLKYREFLAADPKWHDGEIIESRTQ
jgi:quinol monooxygenase YgiN